MKIIRSIATLSLAAVMLVVSVGVTVNMHFCAGKIQSVALYVKTDPCKDQASCHDQHAVKTQGCCAERSIVIKSKESTIEANHIVSNNPVFNLISVALPFLYSVSAVDFSTGGIANTFYKPPLPTRNILIFLQSLLI